MVTAMPDKDYSILWAEALRLIQSRVDDWTFTTWFVQVIFESYDPATNVLQLRVPVRQVYDFIEHFYAQLIEAALKKAATKEDVCREAGPEKDRKGPEVSEKEEADEPDPGQVGLPELIEALVTLLLNKMPDETDGPLA